MLKINLGEVSSYVGTQVEFMRGKELIAGVVLDHINHKVAVVIDHMLSVDAMREMRLSFNEAINHAIELKEMEGKVVV